VQTAPSPQVGFTSEQIDQSANTRDVPLKWVIAVDATLPRGRAANAAICVAGATAVRVPGLLGQDVVDADQHSHPGLPWLGCTVLGATTEQLSSIQARAAQRDDVSLVNMPTQAQHTRVYDDYVFEVEHTRANELEFYAVSLVGPRKVIDKLVKGLSLLA
jgi:hypothetical protein